MMAKNTAFALLCILVFATLAQSGLGLRTSSFLFGNGAQLKDDDVGTLNLINKATLDIAVHCHDRAGPVEILDMGNHNIPSGLSYMNFVPASTTSVLCSFNLGGSQQNLAMWVNNDPSYTLPIKSTDCSWEIDEQGFSLLNPATGQYFLVAGWVSDKLTGMPQ